MMDTNKMREQFEQWWARSEKLTQDWEIEKAFWRVQPLNNYRWPRVHDAWESWKASREAVMVELPPHEEFRCDTSWEEARQEAYNRALDESRSAIEAQDLKVKT